LPAILELAVLESQYGKLIFEKRLFENRFMRWVGGFAFFAFFLYFIEGDYKGCGRYCRRREMVCRTLPIVWGIKKTKIIVYCLFCSLLRLARSRLFPH
jgi:4-hydroxybenzoate polyprenyltransferase